LERKRGVGVKRGVGGQSAVGSAGGGVQAGGDSGMEAKGSHWGAGQGFTEGFRAGRGEWEQCRLCY
jgi:hypothetical protein